MEKIQKLLLILSIFLLYLSPFFTHAQTENDTLEIHNNSFLEAGIVGGMPAYVNILCGYWIDPFGIRLSGMYLAYNSNGVQFNIGLKISEKAARRHCLGAAIGKSQDRGCDYYYLGPVYDFYYKDFFVEAGVCKIIHVIRGDFSSTPYWVILQVGYVHRF